VGQAIYKRELGLRYAEQLVDGGQTQALACMVRYTRKNLAGLDVMPVRKNPEKAG